MPSDFFCWELRKTKKRRRCDRCSKIIQKKQPYCRTRQRRNGVHAICVYCLKCGQELVEVRNSTDKEKDYVIF